MPIRVSIVEDLAEVREGLVDLVQSDEELSMVSSFKDAESAAQKLPELKADIVLMDINLPGDERNRMYQINKREMSRHAIPHVYCLRER
jgi:DNA-binding NarL/FixJ family response regulator